ncbi:hypothetical protein EOE18_13435 [Novosphingobium umbonatum]|uniref:Uncharacterized protein n=1 Tax=Novosphingobium umbonatum TaxID=1908524 RepID=A0A3S2V595_9SPHN|nr:hypothetical protein [Novosphingobium umbonatum]RVU03863.1 hypothetical protein EOE18_13435 [Novosphingobium umbonatum]
MPTSTMNTGRNRIATQKRQFRRLAARHSAKTEAALVTGAKPLHKRRKAPAKLNRHQAMAALRKVDAPVKQDVAPAKTAPAFPAGLVSPKPLGVAIASIAMPEMALPKTTVPKAVKAPATPVAQPATSRPAITLPDRHEPLVANQPSTSQQPTILPRNRALTRQGEGLIAAISAWLSSFGKMLASGFMKKKPRRLTYQPAVPQRGFPMAPRGATPTPSLREKVEVTQLRAENRRLRSRLEEIQAAKLELEEAKLKR